MGDLDYNEYIRLASLHDAVRPLTPVDDEFVHGAEHLFIITHQVAELWLKQVLLDLDLAVRALTDRGLGLACEHLARAAHLLDQVVTTTFVLTRLPPGDFARFRGLLGTASGAQSPQFRELAVRLGVRQPDGCVVYELFEAVLEENSLSVADLYRWGPPAGIPYRLAEVLSDLAQAFYRWQVNHVEIVRRAIGSASGTGGTSGLNHLSNRIELPFPALWAARSATVWESAGQTLP
ncbi:tryptophan 2,3-dioxygenase family protein [Saccharopolyspora hattusasensis]|uniref:tryptophan 2,3-dioxygenase family protein n=1 Tax=Saccharopolyspora hattusasensis TaxID=1128679 RepID=UPI003D95F135